MKVTDFAAVLQFWSKQLKFAPGDFKDMGAVEIWWDHLNQYGLQKIKDAFSQSFRTDDSFPSMRRLLEILDGPTQTRDQMGIEIAGKIWDALGKFGQYKPTEAEEWVGAVGWQVVQMIGGWYNICETTVDSDRGTFVAQARGFAIAILARDGTSDKGHKMLGGCDKTREKVKRLAGGMSKNTLQLL